MQLYSALGYCIGWIANNVPSPSASTPTPQPVGFHTPFPGTNDTWTKVVYAMALASDSNVAAQISLQLANNLRAPSMHPDVLRGETPPPQPDIYSDRLVKYVVVAAPSWKIADFRQQCFDDPSTAGAIVAVQPSSRSSVFNVFFGDSSTTLNVQLVVVNCEPTNTSYTSNATYITSLSHVRAGTGERYNANYGALLALLGTYFAGKTNKVKIYTYGTPKPKNQATPLGWYESSYTLTAPWANEAAVAVAAGSALGANPPFGWAPSIDSQTSGAIASVLPQLVDDVMWTCTKMRPGDVSFPQPQCYWFSYRPATRPKP
jgi:hypothetical protein